MSNCRTLNSSASALEPLLTDELFSSWLIRAAFGFSCKPLVFTGYVWPGWRVWTIDRDRQIKPDRLDLLTQHFDLPSNYFQRAFLKGYIQKMTRRDLPDKGAWPWLLSYGCRNRNSLGGIQFCPTCLATDPAPYFRYYWRFSWNVNCLSHECKLVDRCQKCSRPIEFQLAVKDELNYIRCQSCGFNLAKSKIEQATTATLWLQTKLNNYYNLDSIPIFGQELASNEVFIFIRIIIGFARRAARERASKQARFLVDCGVQESQLLETQSTLSFECLSVSDRERLLSISSTILNMNVEELGSSLNKHSIMRHHLSFAYAEKSFIFDNILQVPEACPRAAKVMPDRVKRSLRGRSEVKSMEARLMRRARLWKP